MLPDILAIAWSQRLSATIDGFRLVNGFIGHFNTQLVTTLYKLLSHTD
jgi:hypothetical protein